MRDFEPFLRAKAAAAICAQPNPTMMRSFDANFQQVVSRIFAEERPFLAQDITLDSVNRMIDRRYPEIRKSMSDGACDSVSVRDALHLFHFTARAEVLDMAPSITSALLWDEYSCVRPILPAEAQHLKQRAFGTYGLLITPEGWVIDSKVVESIGSSLVDDLSIKTLSKCHFIPQRIFERPVSAPT